MQRDIDSIIDFPSSYTLLHPLPPLPHPTPDCPTTFSPTPQDADGDFEPSPSCYPNVSALADGVRAVLNATTMFSFWPEVVPDAREHSTLDAAGCLINGTDLGGRAVDATLEHCREMIWSQMVRPRYLEQGVSAYWLDETDGEGTGGEGDGTNGYDTSYGPAAFASNLWVNHWISIFADNLNDDVSLHEGPSDGTSKTRHQEVARARDGGTAVAPLVLTRGVWAGGQRHGVVLWSSDIESSFEVR